MFRETVPKEWSVLQKVDDVIAVISNVIEPPLELWERIAVLQDEFEITESSILGALADSYNIVQLRVERVPAFTSIEAMCLACQANVCLEANNVRGFYCYIRAAQRADEKDKTRTTIPR